MSSGITRRKGKSGRVKVVERAICGAKVPRDKTVEKKRRSLSLARDPSGVDLLHVVLPRDFTIN